MKLVTKSGIRCFLNRVFGSNATCRLHSLYRQLTLPLRNEFTSDERALLDAVMDRISPGTAMLDIGANSGAWTRELSKLAGSNGVVLAFEPVPRTFAFLRKRCRHLSNVKVFDIALSSENGSTEMLIHRGMSFPATAAVSHTADQLSDRAGMERIEVNTSRLDDLAGKMTLPRVSFIKCDVEGHELEVLRGGIALLQKYKPIIVMEILREKWVGRNPAHSSVAEFLIGFGYQMFQVVNGGISVKMNLAHENFLFIHVSQLEGNAESVLQHRKAQIT